MTQVLASYRGDLVAFGVNAIALGVLLGFLLGSAVEKWRSREKSAK